MRHRSVGVQDWLGLGGWWRISTVQVISTVQAVGLRGETNEPLDVFLQTPLEAEDPRLVGSMATLWLVAVYLVAMGPAVLARELLQSGGVNTAVGMVPQTVATGWSNPSSLSDTLLNYSCARSNLAGGRAAAQQAAQLLKQSVASVRWVSPQLWRAGQCVNGRILGRVGSVWDMGGNSGCSLL